MSIKNKDEDQAPQALAIFPKYQATYVGKTHSLEPFYKRNIELNISIADEAKMAGDLVKSEKFRKEAVQQIENASVKLAGPEGLRPQWLSELVVQYLSSAILPELAASDVNEASPPRDVDPPEISASVVSAPVASEYSNLSEAVSDLISRHPESNSAMKDGSTPDDIDVIGAEVARNELVAGFVGQKRQSSELSLADAVSHQLGRM